MDHIKNILHNYLTNIGINSSTVKILTVLILLISTLIIALLIGFLARKILINVFVKYAKISKTKFDDYLIQNKVPLFLAQIIPLLILIQYIPLIFSDYASIENNVARFFKVLGIFLVLRIARSFLNTLKDYLKTLHQFKDKPIDSYIQVFFIIAWSVAIVFIFAITTGVDIITFLTTIGAASAVILLIFKDTILGFVASIQVSINDMVRIGDWVTFEKYGADGDVIEINLSTVKIQNFDKTITTIPTYALISDSFKNWRGMENSDGRRIKRSLIIKINSVKYLTDTEISALKKITLIKNYINTQSDKIDKYNSDNNIDKSIAINGRNLTNIGVFRKYIDTYLKNHPAINKEMMIMARQLAPTPQGIPLEIYAFSSDKRWKNYEYIISDIFDHLIAATPYFELELFELPNSGNFK